MNFTIAPQIFEKFPDLKLGVCIAKNIDNTKTSEESKSRLQQIQEEVRNKYQKDTLSEVQRISDWRAAYSAFGAKPKKYKCSVENLYRMILDGIPLKHINPLVDIYNYISLKYTVPVGGDDMDRIDGNIILTVAIGDESFIELDNQEQKNPKEGEVIYRDDTEVLCRRWNWRECEKSKMTEQTRNATLVIEALQSISKEELQEILNELSELVNKECGGEITTTILDKNQPSITI